MGDAIERALAAATERHRELMPLLERWVRQNSYTSHVQNVNAMADLMVADFDLPGLQVARHAREHVGDHLSWTTPAWDAEPARRVVLIGHHDTVFPPGTFETWDIEGDVLRGPGVLDMKGGLVVLRTALAALADAGVLAAMPLGVLSVSEEETGSRDSRPLTEEFASGARAALVFEAGRDRDMIITRRKGSGRVTVTATGRAAHSANDHARGRSAIWALARYIDQVERLTDYERGLLLNVGTIEGGSALNTVPAHAQCGISIRFSDNQDGDQLSQELRDIAQTLSAETEVGLEVDVYIARPALQRTEASAALYQTYATCARAAGLGDTECPQVSGGSDANLISAIGVPSIDGMGPRGKGFHTHNEYIEIPTLAQKTQALVRCLLELAPPRASETM